MEAQRKKIAGGLTLIELMMALSIVAILASVAIPTLRGRVDAAKWSEGRAMMGSIATAIRAYHGEKGPLAAAPTTLGVAATGLGFSPGDLTGTCFVNADFALNVTSMYPLQFTVTCTPSMVALNPPAYTMDESGNWTP
ncbi:MAG: type IV pilin protein [Planctomycetota bacterium]|jgi:type IV pilus assembly protein PilE